MYTALLHHPDREQYDISRCELCVSGGSAMPVEVLRGFDEAFGAKVLEGYGLSETTGMGSFNLPDRERKPGSIGVPVGGTEMQRRRRRRQRRARRASRARSSCAARS